jgi:hypothetical protein
MDPAERQRLIEENEQVVLTVVGKLLRHGQKSYIEDADLYQVGREELVRTVDRPATPGAIALDKRVARNVKTTVLRFIGKQIREYTYAQMARAKVKRDAGAMPQGAISPEGDSNDHDANVAASATYREGMKISGLSHGAPPADRDRPSSRARAVWGEAFVGKHERAPLSQSYTVAEAEYREWLRWRSWFWSDWDDEAVSRAAEWWRQALASGPIAHPPVRLRSPRVPLAKPYTEHKRLTAVPSTAPTPKDDMEFRPWIAGNRFTRREIDFPGGRRVDYGSVFAPIHGDGFDHMRPTLECVRAKRWEPPARTTVSPERKRAVAWLFRGNRAPRNFAAAA